jgi:hypothetical protein
MKYLCIPLLILFTLQSLAQNSSRRKFKRYNPPPFPVNILGHWQGEMTWYPNGKPAQKIKVQLHIQPTDTANQYTWQIIYGTKQEDNRPYILKKIDTVANHWVIDEKNGIVLDSYWIGNRFTGAFAVQGNVILDSYWLENDDLHFEFFSYKQTPFKTTGNNTEESPTVDVYKIGSYQKGIMKKKK